MLYICVTFHDEIIFVMLCEIKKNKTKVGFTNMLFRELIFFAQSITNFILL